MKIIYRRSRGKMLTNSAEIEEALTEEGEILFLYPPNRIYREDGKVKLESTRMKLGEVDADGRRRPEAICLEELDFSSLALSTY